MIDKKDEEFGIALVKFFINDATEYRDNRFMFKHGGWSVKWILGEWKVLNKKGDICEDYPNRVGMILSCIKGLYKRVGC